MPFFQRTSEEYKDRGVVFVGVAVSDFEDAALEFAEEVGVTYPLGMDTTGLISDAYEASTLPTTLLIDRNGNQARRVSGAVNGAALKIVLRSLLLFDKLSN